MSKGLCEQQCSIDCPSYFLGDSACDDNDYNFYFSSRLKPGIKPKLDSGCNTKSCQYDKGDCPRWIVDGVQSSEFRDKDIQLNIYLLLPIE